MNNPAKFEVPDSPHMDEGGLGAFIEHIGKSSSYLEYGCGGSTVFAANFGVKNIVAVDTSREWVDAVKDKTSSATEVSVSVSYCDVGPVGDWGRPVNDARIRDYHRYMAMPWDSARDLGVIPDLIMVDGRFRVACLLYSLLCARTGATILFDDYSDRPQYHVVERFCDLVEMRGRMAVFTASKQFSYPAIAEAIAKYSVMID